MNSPAIAVISELPMCWFGIRDQLAVGDKSFLRFMIPHHAGPILMRNQESISNGEVRKLCGEIVKSQQQETDQMKAMLQQLS